jgi:sulfur carrier protein
VAIPKHLSGFGISRRSRYNGEGVVKFLFTGENLNVTVNGEKKELADGTTITGLLEILELKPERLAVEVNRRIVRRANWPATALSDGDRIEIVNFVGGGSLD